MRVNIMKFYYCTTEVNGKIYDVYAEKFPCGAWNLQTKEAREVKDEKYIDWYKKNHKNN